MGSSGSGHLKKLEADSSRQSDRLRHKPILSRNKSRKTPNACLKNINPAGDTQSPRIRDSNAIMGTVFTGAIYSYQGRARGYGGVLHIDRITIISVQNSPWSPSFRRLLRSVHSKDGKNQAYQSWPIFVAEVIEGQ
ncbi:hypothetical protein VNO77_33987 [Canavalia gladiata]|uniref:Uncharacterized protein n=1 Tax=Canavalia gladiata TaxID=3824 RepID=A0AAN9PWW1_CANGL